MRREEQDKARGQVGKHISLIPTPGRLRLDDGSGVQGQSTLYRRFKDSLSYISIPSSHPVLIDYFINLIHTTVTWEEGTTAEELLPPDWPTGKSVVPFLD